MKLKFNFFAKPSAVGAAPSLLASPTGEFANLKVAQKLAFADADNPKIMAHSIVIESIDDDSVNEAWVREGANWKSSDA